MIRETELIAQFTYLERQVLLTWIEEGVIAPRRDEEGYLFDRVDESRVALACDLHYRMGLDHASLPVILSLIDQLHEVAAPPSGTDPRGGRAAGDNTAGDHAPDDR